MTSEITNVDSTVSSTSASFIAPKEKLRCFTTLGHNELNKHITAVRFSHVLGPAIAQKLHLLKLQKTCFLRQTKAASHC